MKKSIEKSAKELDKQLIELSYVIKNKNNLFTKLRYRNQNPILASIKKCQAIVDHKNYNQYSGYYFNSERAPLVCELMYIKKNHYANFSSDEKTEFDKLFNSTFKVAGFEDKNSDIDIKNSLKNMDIVIAGALTTGNYNIAATILATLNLLKRVASFYEDSNRHNLFHYFMDGLRKSNTKISAELIETIIIPLLNFGVDPWHITSSSYYANSDSCSFMELLAHDEELHPLFITICETSSSQFSFDSPRVIRLLNILIQKGNFDTAQNMLDKLKKHNPKLSSQIFYHETATKPSLLVQFAKVNDKKAIEFILEQETEQNLKEPVIAAPDPFSIALSKVLHSAIEKDDFELAEYIINKASNSDNSLSSVLAFKVNNQTAHQKAITSGRGAILELLQKYKFNPYEDTSIDDPRQKMHLPKTGIHFALESYMHDDASVLIRLLESGEKVPKNHRTQDGKYLSNLTESLLFAISQGDASMVQRICERLANNDQSADIFEILTSNVRLDGKHNPLQLIRNQKNQEIQKALVSAILPFSDIVKLQNAIKSIGKKYLQDNKNSRLHNQHEFAEILSNCSDDTQSGLLGKLIDVYREAKSGTLTKAMEALFQSHFGISTPRFATKKAFIEKLKQLQNQLQTCESVLPQKMEEHNYEILVDSFVSRAIDAIKNRNFIELAQCLTVVEQSHPFFRSAFTEKLLKTNIYIYSVSDFIKKQFSNDEHEKLALWLENSACMMNEEVYYASPEYSSVIQEVAKEVLPPPPSYMEQPQPIEFSQVRYIIDEYSRLVQNKEYVYESLEEPQYVLALHQLSNTIMTIDNPEFVMIPPVAVEVKTDDEVKAATEINEIKNMLKEARDEIGTRLANSEPQENLEVPMEQYEPPKFYTVPLSFFQPQVQPQVQPSTQVELLSTSNDYHETEVGNVLEQFSNENILKQLSTFTKEWKQAADRLEDIKNKQKEETEKQLQEAVKKKQAEKYLDVPTLAEFHVSLENQKLNPPVSKSKFVHFKDISNAQLGNDQNSIEQKKKPEMILN